MTSNAIARVEGSSLADRMHYAEALAVASLLPKAYQRQPGNVLLAMEFGDALGIRPIQAINDIHVIEGKPSASADLIASLVRRAGHRLRIWGDDESATATIVRCDDPDYEFSATWTIARAQAAGLTSKTVWKSYRAAMLKARAVTEVARMGASEALHGIALYTPEELGAEVDDRGEMVQRPGPAPKRGGMAGLRDAVAPKVDEPVDADVVTDEPPAAVVNMTTGEVRDTPRAGSGGGSLAETSVAEGRAGSIPAGNTPPLPDDLINPRGKQMKALHAALTEHDLADRDDALAYLSEIVGRELTTSKELTVSEASRCLDLLNEVNRDPFEPAPEDQT